MHVHILKYHNCRAQPVVLSMAPERPQNLPELQTLMHHLKSSSPEALGMEPAIHVLKSPPNFRDNTP